MSNENIKKACEHEHFVTPCVGSAQSCKYVKAGGCTITSLTTCYGPMNDLSQNVCANYPKHCPKFDGVYAYSPGYFPNVNASCGSEETFWCTNGMRVSNRYAFCAKRRNGKMHTNISK